MPLKSSKRKRTSGGRFSAAVSTIVPKLPLPNNPCEMEVFAPAESESLESDIENDEESDWESFP